MLPQAVQRAVTAYQSGDWAGAERLCRLILKSEAACFDALNLLGIVAAQTRRSPEAAEWFERAVAANPNSAAAHSNLGNVLQDLERLDTALACYDRAIAIAPDYAEAHNNRGNALRKLGRLEAALASYDRAIEIKRDYAEAWNNCGLALRDLGRLEAALAGYDRALEIRPGYAEACNNRGNVLKELTRLDEALASYDRALEINPAHAEAWNNRGVVLHDLHRLDEALASYDRALEINPGYAEAFSNRGNALRDAGRPDEALAGYDRALAINPDYAEACNNRGLALRDLKRHVEALSSYDRAIEIRPGYADAWCNRGMVLQELKRFDEALASYAQAIRIKPDSAEARWNRGLCHLQTGNLTPGWEGYEWRWRNARLGMVRRDWPQPLWDGRKLDGSLLVWGEQGVGDEIFYAGMLEDLETRATSVTVCVDDRLVPLFGRSFGNIRVVSKRMPASGMRFDAQIPMGSLGRYLRRSMDELRNAARPYLRACPIRAQTLRARVARDKKLVCGLSWISRNPALGADKSLRLRDLEPVLGVPGIDFVNLQYGDTGQEQTELHATSGRSLEHVTEIDCFDDIDGLAALITACDVVVSVSNTTAHLAAALGKHVLVMLPFSAGLLWYWHAERTDSPWYPTATLFRQPSIGDWASVVDAVREELLRRAGGQA